MWGIPTFCWKSCLASMCPQSMDLTICRWGPQLAIRYIVINAKNNNGTAYNALYLAKHHYNFYRFYLHSPPCIFDLLNPGKIIPGVTKTKLDKRPWRSGAVMRRGCKPCFTSVRDRSQAIWLGSPPLLQLPNSCGFLVPTSPIITGVIFLKVKKDCLRKSASARTFWSQWVVLSPPPPASWLSRD